MVGDSKKLIYAIAAACILVIIIVGALALSNHTSKGFSELYFENPDDLPRLVNIGDKMKLEFTVVSYEKKRCNYRYNVTYDDRIIKSGSFALMPEESNSNRNTIEVDLIPNISSLVKMNSPNIEISSIRYNNTLGVVFSESNGVEDGNIVLTPNGYSILLSGKNATHPMEIELSDRRIIPLDLQISALSAQKAMLALDPTKKESYTTNDSHLEQFGDPSNPKPNILNSLSDFGYILRKDEWIIKSDQGILDIFRRKIETKYFYEFKKVAVRVFSSDSQFRSNITISPNEKPIESNYEIHFWIVVEENPNKLSPYNALIAYLQPTNM